MDLSTFLTEEFARETARSRRALEHVPDPPPQDWKPHEKSMAFGYLAQLVAKMPQWVAMQLTLDELAIAPADGSSSVSRDPLATRAALLEALDAGVAKATAALSSATDAQLQKSWRLKARGQVVDEGTRARMIQDTINHWAHHRGQLTVYLRLLGATVPALYGPSADDRSFGPP